jgi:T5SS/PEP-CTERM-associated repeat protein
VSISLSESLSGDSTFFATLQHDGVFVGEICSACDPPVNTMPTSVSEVGTYGLSAGIDGGSFQGSGESEGSQPTYSFSLNVTVTAGGTPGTEIHWLNPAGGAYDDTANWDPQQVPVHNAEQSDTAFFDAETTDTVTISATNATARRWAIRGMDIDFDGTAQVFSASGAEPSIAIGNGGSLTLDTQATFNSVDAVIGDIGDGVASSDVTVSELGTEWINIGDVTIGDESPATVFVADRGMLEVTLDMHLGKQSAVGELNLDSEAPRSPPGISKWGLLLRLES